MFPPSATGLARAARLLVLAALLPLAVPALAQRALLTHAEQPAKLLRKTAVYDAPAGVALHPGDLLVSGARGVQIEWPQGVLVALGPASTLLVDDAAAFPAVTLLRGWIKVAGGGRNVAGKLTVAAGALTVNAAGSGVVHVAADRTELFVEQGTLAVAAAGKGAPVDVGREQYVVHRAGQGLQPESRPARLFVSEMPRPFFDPLVSVAARAQPAEPILLREASAADVAQWNDVAAPLRKQLAARFAGRLADPAFRAEAENLLADQPEWRQAIKQNALTRKRPDTYTNHLF